MLPNEVRKLKKILAPLLLTLLAISMTSIGLVSANDDGRMQAHEDDDKTEHRMSFFSSPDMVGVRSNLESGNQENHFGLLFSTLHGVTIHVAFSQENNVSDVENEAFLHLRVSYVGLVEFNDTNANGTYDVGTDSVIKSVALTNLSYTPLVDMPKPIISQDGKAGYEIKTNSTNGPDGLVFGVVADIFPQYAVVDNTIVPPTATKISTMILNFPFAHPGSSTDMIALQVRAWSKTVVEHETPTNEESVRVRSATAQGFYTWSPTAMVNGQSVAVKSSFQKAERGWLIDLAYPQGSTIVHDPVLGFDFGATPILTSNLLIGAAIASIGVFGLLVYLGRRQLARVFMPKTLPQ